MGLPNAYGAVGTCGGVVGEDFALGGGELVACGMGLVFLGHFEIQIGL
jgi:hypothetical protein